VLVATLTWPEPARLVLASLAGAAVYVLALRLVARGFFDRAVETLVSAFGRRRVAQEGA
jgi:hypothetical protein